MVSRAANMHEPEPATSRTPRSKARINMPPTQPLDVYVFGHGDYGELGLGTDERAGGTGPIDVPHPLRNELLDAHAVAVVHLAVGSKHCVALTRDNRILTWGCNDLGQLGRDTTSRAQVNDLNPRACTPTPIPVGRFDATAVFAQVVATDSATFALTADGQVYGWGTFLANDGVIGFSRTARYQLLPALLPELKKITKLCGGANHVLALDDKGKVFAWGCGQYNQLGRRVVERTREVTLVPREIGFPRTRIVDVAAGANHNFAVDARGRVWAWGLNNYCETALVEVDENGDEKDAIAAPTVVEALGEFDIKTISAGRHHSIALTADGSVLAWGRCDGGQSGLNLSQVAVGDVALDQIENPRYMVRPSLIPNLHASKISASADCTFALDARDDGTSLLYSWGYSQDHRTGHGSEDDVPFPTVLETIPTTGVREMIAACGDTFAVIAVDAGR